MKKLFSFCLVIAAVFLTLSTQKAEAQVSEYTMIEGSATIYIRMVGTVADEDFPDLWYSYDEGSWTQITKANVTADLSNGYRLDIASKAITPTVYIICASRAITRLVSTRAVQILSISAYRAVILN